MRRVVRKALNKTTQKKLNERQNAIDSKWNQGTLNVEREWKNARRTRALQSVVTTLRNMMGKRERCMYCLDSHGTDIEHFWPKSPYPERMFQWPNLLLCCAECGRLKGDRFPLSDEQPLLVDPTVEDPWMYLDFDPITGNVVSRFDVSTNDWSPKGTQTVDVFQLDRRESLAAGYRKTFLRISEVIQRFLATEEPNAIALLDALNDADDHGLLPWCFLDSGKNLEPFRTFRTEYPRLWEECIQMIAAA